MDLGLVVFDCYEDNSEVGLKHETLIYLVIVKCSQSSFKLKHTNHICV